MLRLARLGGDTPALLAFRIWGEDVRAFDLAGNLLWSYPPGRDLQGVDDVNVVDLNGDGVDEVVVGFNGGSGVRVLDSHGTLVWQSTSIGDVWRVAGGDVLGNGRPQVVTTSGSGLVHVFNHDGANRHDIRPGFSALIVRVGWLPSTVSTATIFAMGTGGEVTALSGDGVQRWAQHLGSPVHSAWLAPRSPFIAIGMRDGAVYVLDTLRGATIASAPGDGHRVEVGWSVDETNGSLLLLVAGPDSLSAYRVAATDGR
jgi:hypothetical protein